MQSSRHFRDLAEAVVASYSGRDQGFYPRIRFWIDFFGDKPVEEITTDDVEDGIDALTRRGKQRVVTRPVKGGVARVSIVDTGERLSDASINRYISALGSCFKALRRLRLLPRGFANPILGVGRLSENVGRTLHVTVDDVRRLVAACRVSRNAKLAALVSMGCTTGWRLSTLQALRWDDIDLAAGLADTSRTKNGTPHRAVLLEWVLAELKRIRPIHPAPGEPVFGSGDFRKAWTTALRRADLPCTWTFHHCRHIAASVLAQSGASVITIMQALNHKSPNMAMRYSHLNTASLRESLGRAWG